MKATDMMMYDWVLLFGYPVHWEAQDYHKPEEYIKEYYKPIPLTPEILEKNRFRYELDYGSFYRSIIGDSAKEKEPYVSIRWNSKGKVCCWEVSNKTSFMDGAVAYGYNEIAVHELQHALRLCGLDDLAENFKV